VTNDFKNFTVTNSSVNCQYFIKFSKPSLEIWSFYWSKAIKKFENFKALYLAQTFSKYFELRTKSVYYLYKNNVIISSLFHLYFGSWTNWQNRLCLKYVFCTLYRFFLSFFLFVIITLKLKFLKTKEEYCLKNITFPIWKRVSILRLE